MRSFKVERKFDTTGVSGTGIVAEGVEFSDSTCVIRWITKQNKNSTNIYASFDDFYDIHVKSHPENMTNIVWSESLK